MIEKRQLKVGDVVHYVDPVGVPHTAMVTAWWSETCCNVVRVSSDPSKTDDYGRQIERVTSVLHKSSFGSTYGNYWKWPEEELNPIVAPMAV